jgi:hypothetical protein
MKRKLFLVAGFAISAICLVWVFSAVDPALIRRALKEVDYLWLVPSLAAFYGGMYLRAVRWGMLFLPGHRLGGREMFRPMMIGFAFNNILPSGRVGEFVRAFYVGRRMETGFPKALATIFTERLFDGVTILICLAASLAMLPDPTGTIVSFAGFEIEGSLIASLERKAIVGCAVVAIGAIAFMIPAVPKLVERAIRATPGIDPALQDKLVGALEGLARGFDALREPRALAFIILHSLAIWGTCALSIYALAFGFPGIRLTYFGAVAVMSLTALFILLPAAPGYWGLYEAGALFAIELLGAAEDDSTATTFALLVHLVQFAPIVVVGLIFAAQSHVKVRVAKEAAAESPRPAATNQ